MGSTSSKDTPEATKDMSLDEPTEADVISVDEDDNIQYTEAVIEKAADGSFIAVASTNSVDRHGEVVDNNGWDLKAYKKNPIILWAHDHTEPAIGGSKKTWVDGVGKKAKLMIQPVLHDVTEKARAVKQLVEMGIIKSLSVGFRPLESADGVTFDKNELLEVSVVNVPANADAMMMAYKTLKKSGFEDSVIKELGVKQMDETQMKNSIKGMQTAIKTMQGHMTDMMGNMGMKSIDELIDKYPELKNDVNEVQTLVKAASVNPKKKPIEQRISMLKVIARASDKYLEDSKTKKVDARKYIKVIKKATEILTVAEKDKLNG